MKGETFEQFTTRLISNSVNRFPSVIEMEHAPMIGQELALLTELLIMRYGSELYAAIGQTMRLHALERNGFCTGEVHSGLDIPPTVEDDYLCTECRASEG